MTTDNPNEDQDITDSQILFRIRPYPNDKDAIKAAEHFTSLKYSPSDKRKILDRLFISDEYFADVAPILLASFQRLEPPTRHQILDNIIRLIIKGVDFTHITTDIAKLMCDSNYQFREKATSLLIHMGESALPAKTRMISYLRYKLKDVQLSALKVLSAIGPKCAEQALPKLKSYLNGASTPELKDACKLAIKILKGEAKPLHPKIEIAGIVDKKSKLPDDSNEDDEESAATQPSTNFPAIRGKVIVIAEDQDSVRAMISKAITSCGGNTKEAADGSVVLKLIQAKIDVDLFILDLMMPNVSGADVLKVIRETPQYALTPVFIVSARTERSLMMRMAQLEVAAYLTKPFKIINLLTTINNTFGQK